MYFAYTVYDRLPLIRTTFNQSVGLTESDIFPIRTTSSHADKDSLKQAL